MRKVILYSATSLDNFISTKDGSVDWLFTDSHYGYFEFYASIDTTLMGNKTYEKVLSFGGEFPYKDCKNFIFTTKKNRKNTVDVTFISENIIEFIKELKNQKGKNIWLIGGGQINTLLLNAGLIDEMVLSVHPTILGDGIRLFENLPKYSDFILMNTKSYSSGLVQLFLKAKN